MDLDKINELIKIVEDSQISSLAIEDGDQKVEIVKQSQGGAAVAPSAAATPAVTPAAPGTEAAAEDHGNLTPIKSPMIGTFYLASSPDSPPYVKTGDKISKGQVVCIVEAMKTFNEIESEVTGTVERILIDNAQSVDFGQVIMLVKED